MRYIRKAIYYLLLLHINDMTPIEVGLRGNKSLPNK